MFRSCPEAAKKMIQHRNLLWQFPGALRRTTQLLPTLGPSPAPPPLASPASSFPIIPSSLRHHHSSLEFTTPPPPPQGLCTCYSHGLEHTSSRSPQSFHSCPQGSAPQPSCQSQTPAQAPLPWEPCPGPTGHRTVFRSNLGSVCVPTEL